MSKTINKSSTIYEVCKYFDKKIKTDFGGGSLLSKTFLMAYLVKNQKLKKFIEIGVYKGKSFFPTAYSIYKNKGKSYGIDPYSLEHAIENDVEPNLFKMINEFLEKTNFNKLYKSVKLITTNSFFSKSLKIIKQPSEDAFNYFKNKNIEVDLVHIDGNHDTKFVEKDYSLYYKILKNGGFFVFDDIDWPSIRVVYDKAKLFCIEVFSSETFGILLKKPKNTLTLIEKEKISKRLTAIYHNVSKLQSRVKKKPTVTVGILTYNHANYIKKCINSVLNQEGNFDLKIYIGDDCSNDGTSELIDKILSKLPKNDRKKIIYYKNLNNLGVIKNLQKILNSFDNSDYFTFCEGDDYYSSKNRLSHHVKYHQLNPETVLSFNKYKIYYQNLNIFETYQPKIVKEGKFTTENLILENFIGNFSSCFYNSKVLSYIKDDLFNMYTVDWMFNIFCSQYGEIGYINKNLSVYRKHEKGAWSSVSQKEQIRRLIKYIDQYNAFLNFEYDKYFGQMKNYLLTSLNEPYFQNYDIVIIDDVFPNPLSGFRFQEFKSILNNFESSKIYTSGDNINELKTKDSEQLLIEFKRKYPNLAGRVERYYFKPIFKSKIIYSIFLNNTYNKVIEIAEETKTPFVFTLYPGGGFGLNNRESNKKLKRIFSSPCFKKVIVTQKTTYDYLIKNRLCSKEKIVFIYGVVTPLFKFNNNRIYKNHFQFDKNSLDIAFVAHRYTNFGEDKGYDVFIEVAKLLSSKYKFINFHVVGPYNKRLIDVSKIENITFYGTKEPQWLDNFFQNIDIILSPNINGKISKGCFDGFPTGSSTDAALNEVVMFSTDPLKMNIKFSNNKDIIIINYDVKYIVEKIVYFISRPEELKKIAINGRKKTKQLYNFKKQIKPRLNLLEKSINEPFYINNFKLWKINLKSKINRFTQKIVNKLLS